MRQVGTTSGQASLEYALVVFGLMAVGFALYALFGHFADGWFEENFLQALTHRLGWGVFDVLAY